MSDELKFYVVGTPIEHSLSPLMHQAAFDAAGVAARFLRYDPLSQAGFSHWCFEVEQQVGRGKDVGGFCATIPYKGDAFKRCAHLSHAAQMTRAVNVVTRATDGSLVGDNTDAPGFLAALALAFNREDLRPLDSDSRALVFGTGGVARAITYALIDAGVGEIVVSSRALVKAQSFISAFEAFARERSTTLIARENAAQISDEPFDVIVNATPLGLSLHDVPVADDAWLEAHARFIFDAVYARSGTTPLIESARSSGIPCEDGRSMLIEQGIIAQEIWQRQFHFWHNKEGRERAYHAMTSALIQ